MSDYKELLSQIAHCMSEESCDGCTLNSGSILDLCVDKLLEKASDAIEQLVKERDAAIADLKNVRPCIACKHIGFGLEHCKHCFSDNCFEWRGVQEVEHEGD